MSLLQGRVSYRSDHRTGARSLGYPAYRLCERDRSRSQSPTVRRTQSTPNRTRRMNQTIRGCIRCCSCWLTINEPAAAVASRGASRRRLSLALAALANRLLAKTGQPVFLSGCKRNATLRNAALTTLGHLGCDDEPRPGGMSWSLRMDAALAEHWHRVKPQRMTLHVCGTHAPASRRVILHRHSFSTCHQQTREKNTSERGGVGPS